MKEIYPDLFETEAEHPFRDNDFKTSAFLLLRPEGNLFVYGPSEKIEKHFDFIESKGGITKHYVSHIDEVSKYCDVLRERFDTRFYCPELEKEETAKKCTVDGTFSGDSRLEHDFDVIFTPGHTMGSSCFLWRSPERRILFTGDNLFLDENERWSVFIQRKNAGPEVVESLKKIHDLDVDVLVGAGHYLDQPHEEVGKERWTRIIDETIDRVEAGGTR